MSFSRRLNLVLAASALAALVSLGVYGYLVYAIDGLKTSVSKVSGELGSNLSRETTESGVKAVLKATETERVKLDTYFIDVKGTPRFLEALASLGKDAGIVLSFDSIDVDSNSALRINFRAQGTFGNLFRFLSLIEASPYALEVGNLNLNKINVFSGKPGEKSENSWSANGTLRLLSFVNE